MLRSFVARGMYCLKLVWDGFHEPRGKLNIWDKQETALIEDVEVAIPQSLHLRGSWHQYICVTHRGTELISPCLGLLYPRVSLLLVSLVVCYIVLPAARSCAAWDDNNKINVCKPSIPAGLKCPPLSKTISPITWFGTILNRGYISSIWNNNFIHVVECPCGLVVK